MKKTLFAALLLLSFGLYAQEGGKEFYSPEFKWTIKIPDGFQKTVPDEEEEEDDDEADILVFSVDAGEDAVMEATYSTFELGGGDTYDKTQEFISGVMKDALERQFEGADVDVDLKTEKISGHNFYHHIFTINYSEEGVKINIHMFNSLFEGDKDLNMTITYLDKKNGDRMLKAFRNSEFK